MNIIVFSPNDLNEIIALFRESVAHVGNDHYTPEQLKAWAPYNINEVRGFILQKEYKKTRLGESFINYLMFKKL